jgi:hypothetical protein
MKDKQKELKKEYQQGRRQMGVYQIRNLANEKVLLGTLSDLPGILNRHKFALRMGSHQNRALQADWNEAGEGGFAFEVLDELTPSEGADRDYRAELEFLEELWLEKLQPYGDRGYNVRKKGREERIGMIAEKRSNDD